MAGESIVVQSTVEKFLSAHKLHTTDLNVQQVVEAFLHEMELGLAGKESSLRMIPTYIEANNEFMTDTPVIAIDAGGTNFRTALVTVAADGQLKIEDMVNHRMPGLEHEISKQDFFEVMAEYLRPYMSRAQRIGFCFSYATEILPNRDGILIEFSKEVKAKAVEGERIGENLLATLHETEKSIVLLNDTVATLLAGKSASLGKTYDSFIGFILGTGTNTCYIEKNSNISKVKDLDGRKSQIINIESGNFNKMPSTDIDEAFEKTTTNPGSYSFEKMISGAYFGGISLTALKQAAREGLFTAATANNIIHLEELTSEEVNQFLKLDQAINNPLQQCLMDNRDEINARIIIQHLLSRGAKLVAAKLAATVLKSGRGQHAEKPILITVEGTTFYKLHNFKAEFEKEFFQYLSGPRQRYCEFIQVSSSSLVGAALAALIH